MLPKTAVSSPADHWSSGLSLTAILDFLSYTNGLSCDMTRTYIVVASPATVQCVRYSMYCSLDGRMYWWSYVCTGGHTYVRLVGGLLMRIHRVEAL